MKQSKVILAIFTSLLFITSCQPFAQKIQLTSVTNNTNSGIETRTTIKGKVEFPSSSLSHNSSSFTTKATITEIAPQATVSILYPSDHLSNPNMTVATGLTNSTGQFTINPGTSFNPALNSVYVLEASKRIGDAGNDIMALRTYIKWNGNTWDSMTFPGIYINSKTTALSIIQNFNKSNVSALQTIGKIDVSTGNSVPLNIGTPTLIEPQTVIDVANLVTKVLLFNYDPVQYIKLVNDKFKITNPPFIPIVFTSIGKIVFASNRDGNFNVHIMNEDGSNQTNLTNNSGFGIEDGYPSFSPDGNKIVFSSGYSATYNEEIYVMNLDGTNKTKLTDNTFFDRYPAFSPDASKIVFSSARDGNPEIYLMNADGSNQTRLTSNSLYDSQPSFSPDGSKIVFSSGYSTTNSQEIYVMNLDGTNRTQLTNNAEIQIDDYPSFSPDGSKIVFESNRDGTNQIYIMNSDGTNQTRLTNNGFHDLYPSFSPNGNKIIFTSTRDTFPQIYVMNIDGTNQSRLTNNILSNFAPKWK